MSADRWVLAPGWAVESGVGGFSEKGDRWVCVRHLESQCGQDFYEDRDPLIFGFLSALAAAPAAPAAEPVDMVLHCPKCGTQHIDAPEPVAVPADTNDMPAWVNQPHRSHLCHGCGHIWRPADVPTNGVAAVKTTGKADSPITAPGAAPAAESPEPLTDEQIDEAQKAWIQRQYESGGETGPRGFARAIERAHGIGSKP